jgi:predicted tellurium resistance membrane protein TerC
MENILTFSNVLSLVTLTGLEIVLGIDNLIFIALVSNKLPNEKRQKARFIGLSLALVMRVVMLFGASWMISLTEPILFVLNFGFSGRSLLLIFGGLFLIVKCIIELYKTFDEVSMRHIDEEQVSSYEKTKIYTQAFYIVVAQIVLVDFIFSFDSIIVAVGISNNIPVIMLFGMKVIADFIATNPSIKIIAIAFIILIGADLFLAGFDIDIPKTYIYFAMFFSIATEFVSIQLRERRHKFVAAGGKIIHH